jgi:FkbM family methyltransferase
MNEWWLKQVLDSAIPKIARREVAIDVGANTGEWTLALSPHFERVYAVEPDERASSLIQAAPNVQIISAAVSDRPGEVTLYKRATTGHNSLLRRHPIGGEGQAAVPVTEESIVKAITLDDSFPSGADFVKIDIEGGEILALSGCSGERWDRTFFIVECHDTFRGVAAMLTSLGKRVTDVQHPLSGVHPGHCWAIGVPAGWM